MLAYLCSEEAFAVTREVAAKHSSRQVRIAAINSYLFNHNDSAKAQADLSQQIQSVDRKFIGLPQCKSDMKLRDFEENVRGYYDKYPGERPPAPVKEQRDIRIQAVTPVLSRSIE